MDRIEIDGRNNILFYTNLRLNLVIEGEVRMWKVIKL